MRRSPRNVRIACEHRGWTPFGGAYFFHEFLRVRQLRDFLAQQIGYPRRNRDYRVSQMLRALIYPLVPTETFALTVGRRPAASWWRGV